MQVSIAEYIFIARMIFYSDNSSQRDKYINEMSNYFPLSMKQWKIQKHGVNLQINLKDAYKQSPLHHSQVIHSFCTPNHKQPSRPNRLSQTPRSKTLPSSKFQMRSSGGFKTCPSWIKNYLKQSLNSSDHFTSKKEEVVTNSPRKRQIKIVSITPVKESKRMFKQRQKKMHLSIPELLVITSCKSKSAKKAALLEDSIRFKVFSDDQSDQFQPYRKRRTVSAQCQTNKIDQKLMEKKKQQLSMEGLLNQYKYSEKKQQQQSDFLFLSGKESHLHSRQGKLHKTKEDIKDRFREELKKLEEKRQKRMKKLHHKKIQQIVITPWEMNEKKRPI